MDEDKVIQKLEQHDKQFDVVIKKLVEHDEQLADIREKMVTKKDYEKHTELLEEIATIVKTTRQEQVFTLDLVKKLEKRDETQDEDIKKIKIQLKMA